MSDNILEGEAIAADTPGSGLKPVPATLHEDIADGPEGGEAHLIRTSDNIRIRVGFWRAGNRGTVLILPGRCEYIEKYGPTAADLANNGYSTAVVDWRGQGLSDRLINDPYTCHVDDFRDHQKDLAAMMDHLAVVDAPQPFHILAHSMGGAIALRALVEGLDVSSAAFTAPLWGVRQFRPTRAAIRFALWCVRMAGYGERPLRDNKKKLSRAEVTDFKRNCLTSHEPTYRWLHSQSRAHPGIRTGYPSARWIQEAFKECRALRKMPSPAVPCLTILGTKEAVVSRRAIRKRMENWPFAGLRPSMPKLIEIPGCRHEPLMEAPEIRDMAIRNIVEHFDRHGWKPSRSS